jgi:hypothetical protein
MELVLPAALLLASAVAARLTPRPPPAVLAAGWAGLGTALAGVCAAAPFSTSASVSTLLAASALTAPLPRGMLCWPVLALAGLFAASAWRPTSAPLLPHLASARGGLQLGLPAGAFVFAAALAAECGGKGVGSQLAGWLTSSLAVDGGAVEAVLGEARLVYGHWLAGFWLCTAGVRSRGGGLSLHAPPPPSTPPILAHTPSLSALRSFFL